MTAIFVHGVPEDLHVWDDLRAALPGVETVALNLPGFGTPLPEGFKPTKDSYAAWLTEQLERFGGPVDLVGHDWGGLLSVRVGLTRPDLLRSLVTDVISLYDPRYVWHDLARAWQTPGVGEQSMAKQEALTDEQRTAWLVSVGVPERYARRIGAADPVKNRCILELYRSAMFTYDEWGKGAGPIQTPALALVIRADRFVGPELARDTAERLGFGVEELDGVGHWWFVEDPQKGADVLKRFWDTLG